MISFEEYKKIVKPILSELTELERKRCIEVKKIRNELHALAKTGKIDDMDKFDELLEDWAALEYHYYSYTGEE